MVAPQERHARGVPSFQQEEEGEGFERVEAPVHEVAHEDVRGGRDFAARGKQFEQVVELAVDVAADLGKEAEEGGERDQKNELRERLERGRRQCVRALSPPPRATPSSCLAHRDRAVDGLDVGLLDQDLLDLRR